MNKAQKKAKERRRAERELIMTYRRPYVTRYLLASEQAIERWSKKNARRNG